MDLKKEINSMHFKKGELSDYLELFERKIGELKGTGTNLENDEIIATLLASMPPSYHCKRYSIYRKANRSNTTICNKLLQTTVIQIQISLP